MGGRAGVGGLLIAVVFSVRERRPLAGPPRTELLQYVTQVDCYQFPISAITSAMSTSES